MVDITHDIWMHILSQFNDIKAFHSFSLTSKAAYAWTRESMIQRHIVECNLHIPSNYYCLERFQHNWLNIMRKWYLFNNNNECCYFCKTNYPNARYNYYQNVLGHVVCRWGGCTRKYCISSPFDYSGSKYYDHLVNNKEANSIYYNVSLITLDDLRYLLAINKDEWIDDFMQIRDDVHKFNDLKQELRQHRTRKKQEIRRILTNAYQQIEHEIGYRFDYERDTNRKQFEELVLKFNNMYTAIDDLNQYRIRHARDTHATQLFRTKQSIQHILNQIIPQTTAAIYAVYQPYKTHKIKVRKINITNIRKRYNLLYSVARIIKLDVVMCKATYVSNDKPCKNTTTYANEYCAYHRQQKKKQKEKEEEQKKKNKNNCNE